MGKYKVWGITVYTKKETSTSKIVDIHRIVKKVKNSEDYLYETDDLEELRKSLVEKYECTLVSLNYDSV